MEYPHIGLIGGGNMGNCLIGGLIENHYPREKIWVGAHQSIHCQTLQQKWSIYATTNNREIASQVDILVLAVKPSSIPEVLADIKDCLLPHTLLISIAAGMTTQQIQRWLNHADLPLVRAMPNTPALVGYGITGLFATHAVNALQQQQAEKLFQSVGQTVWLAQESWLDIVTALSGSGPAYFFYFMECLIKSATENGLPPDIASKLTLNTALGSSYLALNSPRILEALRAQVTSPGGTTEQGIKALKNGKLAEIVKLALQDAIKRSKTLTQQYD